MNPPMVYDVTNPRAHMIKRITKIVQSMFNSFLENQPCRVPALTGQFLALDHLQVISDSFDAFYLRGNRAGARLLVGGLDFAGQDHNTVVGLDAHT